MNQSSNPDLKPCPSVICWKSHLLIRRSPAFKPVWVECQTCGSRTKRYRNEQSALAAWNRRPEPITEEVHVVFDGPPSHESGRFVEVENAQGRGIRAGEWQERKDGLWALVFKFPRPSAWIPCSDRMPEERTEVLVFCPLRGSDGEVLYGWRQGGIWWVDGPLDAEATHWQPLPPPSEKMLDFYGSDAGPIEEGLEWKKWPDGTQTLVKKLPPEEKP